MKRHLVLPIAAVAALLLPACRGCSDEKPYTPFGTTTALPAPEPAPSASAAARASASASAGPPVEHAARAPAGATRWQLGDRTLEAPPGYAFEQAVTADFGSGATETAAWLVADGTDAGLRAAGALWLYPAAGAPRELLPLPGFVPNGPGCKLVTSLDHTGPHTVTLDAHAECQGGLIARVPLRALVVVAPDAERPELMGLRIASPAPGETLELVTDTSDRDGDGRDDVSVEVTGGPAAGPKTTVPLLWFDRAAGPSRDGAEPARTLARLAAREAARAKTKKLADDVLANVASLRRTMGSLCAESATARILDADDNPLACGALGPVIDSLATAELGAALARADVLGAFGVLSRDGWYFGKTSPGVRQKLERLALDAVEPTTAVVRLVEARPAGLDRAPRYSPLAFDADGTLFVQTAAGTVRTEPDGTASGTLDASAPRSLDVLVAPGQRFSGPIYSCDRSEVTLGIEGGDAIVTTLLSPRPGACGHAPFWASAAPPTLIAGAGKLRAVVGDALVGDAVGGPALPGSARSPNGAWFVVPTSFGLLIEGAEHRLVSLGPLVSRPAALTDCVVSSTGKVAACIQRNQALRVQLP